MIKSKLLFITLLLVTFQVSSKDTIRVGVKSSPPFVIIQEDDLSGISVMLWENIAKQLNLAYRYVKYPVLKDLLADVEKRNVDLCISPLTVTSKRIANISFSLPIYISNIAIATKKENKNSILLFVKKIFSADFIRAVTLLFFILFCFGYILWLFERKKNPEQFRRGIKGIWDGFWWSAVTMTTVGYGDKSPISVLGRIIALIWMFTSVIVISSFTASIASSLTIDQLQNSINSFNDLNNYKLGTVEQSSTNEKLTKIRLKHSLYATVDDLIDAVYRDEIDFAIYDEPMLKYMIHQKKMNKQLHVFMPTEIIQYYSFSAPKNSEILELLNPYIISFIESDKWDQILNENHIYK